MKGGMGGQGELDQLVLNRLARFRQTYLVIYVVPSCTATFVVVIQLK
jgi:hypothetical protein